VREAVTITIEQILKASALLDAADVPQEGRVLRCMGKHINELRAQAGARPLNWIEENEAYEAMHKDGLWRISKLVVE
jgi:hypothetical protein